MEAILKVNKNDSPSGEVVTIGIDHYFGDDNGAGFAVVTTRDHDICRPLKRWVDCLDDIAGMWGYWKTAKWIL